MNLSNPELETVLRCVDKVFDFRAERDRLRDLLATLEPENKDLRARVAELEAREKQAREDEDWAHLHAVPIHRRGDAWVAEHFDGHRILEAASASITEAIRALREKMEAKP